MKFDIFFAEQLFEQYENYKETKLYGRRIKHKDVSAIICEMKNNQSLFEITEEGLSVEGRAIYSLKIGTGNTNIILWSQMHGDESTATRALFDIYKFFLSENFADERNTILENCTLTFIPMLNPDGAERFDRRNAPGIDLNRDALKLSCPESQILMRIVEHIKPQFAFNLHDQDPYYTVGDTASPAAMSFLSPSFDFEKSEDTSRRNGMAVISLINNVLQEFVPNKIGRYSDAFLPSAFGDCLQRKGISTILVESGSVHYDLEKEFIRRLNFVSLISGILAIAENLYLNVNQNIYKNIPFNKKDNLFDLILKNITLSVNNFSVVTDLGLRRNFGTETDDLIIQRIGDLNTDYAYEVIDCKQHILKKSLRVGDSALVLKDYFKTSGLASEFVQYAGLLGL